MNDVLSLQSNAASDRIDGQIESLKAMSMNGQKKMSDKQMRETANQFEEIVMRQLIKEMRKTVSKDGIIEESHATEMYMEMVDDHLAKQMAEANGIGIGDMVYNELKEKNDHIVDPSEARAKRDFINLNNQGQADTKVDYLPLNQNNDDFMNLNHKNRMMDLLKSNDPFKSLDWKHRVTTDRIENR